MKDRIAKVLKNYEIAKGIYQMQLSIEDMPQIMAGQFVQIKLPDQSFLLRRPFCISDFSVADSTIEVIYQIKGDGTKCLSAVAQGSSLVCLLPLGNGFNLAETDKKIVLLGGGMGSVVLPSVISQYPDRQYYSYLGFATKQLIVCDDLAKKCKASVVTTDDGSNGNKGYVTAQLLADIDKIQPDVILCCGPEPMYAAMQKAFAQCTVPIKISLEGRMGCGFGACLVCACKIKKAGTTQTLRVCKDGPVFNLCEVEL